MRLLRWSSSVHLFLSQLALGQEGGEGGFVSDCQGIPVGTQGGEEGIQLLHQKFTVIQEKLCPHPGIQPGYPGQIFIAARREALVVDGGGGFDEGVADDVGHLAGEGDDPVVILRRGHGEAAEATGGQGILDPIQQIASIFADFQSAQASAERVIGLIDAPIEVKDTPEVVEKYGDVYPELKINRHYVDMIREMATAKGEKSESDKEAIQFIKNKIDSAKWFMSAIKQRHDTLMRTMQTILDYQREYFKDGDRSKLRPMILKDIADRTGLDVSTISRVVNSKYVQTQFGIILLKSLFSEAMQTQSGEEVSSYEVKNILQEAISGENKRKPLTDEQLMNILNDKGYCIARRTVAKYREMLDIPVARLRKQI